MPLSARRPWRVRAWHVGWVGHRGALVRAFASALVLGALSARAEGQAPSPAPRSPEPVPGAPLLVPMPALAPPATAAPDASPAPLLEPTHEAPATPEALAKPAPELSSGSRAAPAPSAAPASPSAPAPVSDPAEGASAAREQRDKNFVHVEVLGNGGLYSVNYSRLFWDDFTARIGISYLALDAGFRDAGARAQALTVPVVANYLGLGSERHKLELGLGMLFLYTSGEVGFRDRTLAGDRVTIAGSATVGYRYLAVDGFTINVGITPLFGAGVFLPWGAVGLGHTF